MAYREQMPEPFAEKCRRTLREGEIIHITAATDLSEELRFDERWLVVTDQRLLRLDPDGANGTAAIDLKDIQSAAVEDLVGAGRLNVNIGGEMVDFIHYTPSQRAKFAEIAKGIDQLAKHQPLEISAEIDRTRCATCGMLLPEPNGLCPACTDKFAVLGRIMKYLKPFRGLAALMVGASLVYTLAELGPPWIMKHILDDVLAVESAVPQNERMTLLYILVAAFLCIRLVAYGLELLRGRLAFWLAGHVAIEIRNELYQNLMRLNLKFFNKRQVGTLISRVTNDAESMQFFLIDGLPYMLTNALLLIGILIFLFVMSWKLTLCVLIPVPFIVLGGTVFFDRLRRAFRMKYYRWAKLVGLASEMLSSVRVMKAFAQEQREMRRFDGRNEEVFHGDFDSEKEVYLFFGTMSLLTSTGLILVW